MSNIIDGIDYGMGYEPTTEYAPNIEWWDKGDNTWSETCWSSQESLAVEIARHGTVYRRPLPIISQHPGAIPLEPGEELVEGECYLMRDGRLTGPMPCDGHEAFPFGVDGTPDTWHRDGSCWENALSRNDIIARLPKVENEEPEKQIDRLANFIMAEIPGEPSQSEGAIDTAIRLLKARQTKMRGKALKRIHPEDSDTQFRLVRAMLIDCYQMAWSKHPGTSLIRAAIETMLPEGVSASDYSELRRIQEADMAAQPNATQHENNADGKEPEKAKEEKKMENTNLIDIGAVHYADFHGTPANFRIPIIEAARIAQLPEVIAEVERQRAEKEIKVGDWFWAKSGTPDRAHAIGIEKPEVLGQSDKWHKAQDCTKIHDPAFVALLERGA